MSTRLHISFLAVAALLFQAGTAAAELPERNAAAGRATSANGFAALAAVEAEPLGSIEMDEVRGRSNPPVMTSQITEISQQFNMQYLMLQQAIQAENRQFTALSNIVKTKHDTAKNALNNLK